MPWPLTGRQPRSPAAEGQPKLAAYFAEFADWLETIASAVESGDQSEIDAAVAAFAESARSSEVGVCRA